MVGRIEAWDLEKVDLRIGMLSLETHFALDRKWEADTFGDPQDFGALAQLVERLVRNEKVSGSNPLCSTPFGRSGVRSSLGGKVRTKVVTDRR